MAATYGVEWAPSASKELKKLPREVQSALLDAADALGPDPYPSGCKKLKGKHGQMRVRVGDFRLIYVVDGKRIVVTIVRVADRKEAYR